MVLACALERDDLRRSAFMNTIADEVPDPHMMMFIDEAARNQRTSQQSKGWAVLGKECIQRQFSFVENTFPSSPSSHLME